MDNFKERQCSKTFNKTGWLSPTGEFFECSLKNHKELAEKLGFKQQDLDDLNWVKLTRSPYLRGHNFVIWMLRDLTKNPTTMQATWLNKNEFDLNNYDN